MHFGFGANWLTQPIESGETSGKLRSGYRLGTCITVPQSSHLAIEIGAFLDRRAGRFSYDAVVLTPLGDLRSERWTREVEATYLVANPLTVRASFSVGSGQAYIKTGALLGLLMSATGRLEVDGQSYRYTTEWDITAYATTIDRALIAAAGMDFSFGSHRAFAEATFLWGLDSIEGDSGICGAPDSGVDGAKYRTGLLNVGLRF